jgi:hypothetical protein
MRDTFLSTRNFTGIGSGTVCKPPSHGLHNSNPVCGAGTTPPAPRTHYAQSTARVLHILHRVSSISYIAIGIYNRNNKAVHNLNY